MSELTREEYWDDIRFLVEELQWGLSVGEIEDPETWIHETIDGHSSVIYYHLARQALAHTANPDAIEEVGFEVGVGESVPWCQMAYCAMEADLQDHIWVLNGGPVDWNDSDKVREFAAQMDPKTNRFAKGEKKSD